MAWWNSRRKSSLAAQGDAAAAAIAAATASPQVCAAQVELEVQGDNPQAIDACRLHPLMLLYLTVLLPLLLLLQLTRPPRHIAAAVSPTRQGVLGITRHTLAAGPAASNSCDNVMPAAMLMTNVLSLSAGRASMSTVCTYWGFTDTKTTSLFWATYTPRAPRGPAEQHQHQ
jgi:hypothetical protein